ncbi:MAG: hypothetical protein COT26_01435 [Candidatus Kerfeldbacteria bacterium CG08_land_8_20_14_0_20_43_14]|uniref:Uncharacterized protein n=1 Tax=Candidatus Kerfeldbacteria bacterium CG08_land_8_20_14_0_20_43_14 TaxID=2014246 RepID=A0A2H0YR97_9BACT|nr:MAG: hypothetical protein COT26_01435 [Candidatus Kerfeldbacteria bacterium CG08_land_8_20_14_0_20_43_14]
MPKKIKKKIEKNNPLSRQSFLHSLGVVAYIIIVAFVMMHGDSWFGNMNNILGPIAFLMLFTLSAAIVGLLVFGRPVYLFLNGQKKEALSFMFHTLAFLFVEAIIIFVILISYNFLVS